MKITPKSYLASTCLLLVSCPLAGRAQTQDPAPPTATTVYDGRTSRTMDEIQKRRAEAIRATLRRLDFKDEKLQNAVVDYAHQREEERSALDVAAARLERVIRDKDATDLEVTGAMDAVRQAAAAERDRRDHDRAAREQNEKDLDAQIGFSKSPRLEAALRMLGIIGDDSALLSDAAPGFETAPAAPSEAPRRSGGGSGGGGRHGMGGGFPRF